ncbi:beta-lactamase family protein [Roseomonas sp. OT10]|uniref:serine hydrolase domain-containing protein n=1 Tax=Roseomonas cutis TaxID=2897332 RepID=UPI001E2F9FDD|nr:serine hydrolase [Roseomonas sp. OT10]UFN51282.1 beta-lactamase family protein [Roseomonas sp. OT10]
MSGVVPILSRRRVGAALLAPAAAALAPYPSRAQPAAAPLAEVLQQAAALTRLHTLIVLRDGEILAERTFRGAPPDRAVNIKSASKSVLAILVGIAIERGVLQGPDQPLVSVLGNRVPPEADPRVRDITIAHLLSMRAGLERTSGENYGAFANSRDWVRFILSRPMAAEPGGPMLYSTGSTHLLSAALTRASGRSTLDLARDWLGGPLDIAIPPWPRDPQGIYFGGNDMLLSPRALLRFGEMLRLGGRWRGRTVVSQDWIRASWSPQARSPWSGQLYGLGWWIGQARGESGTHPVFFAWGYGGQMLYIVPELALTVVMTSDPTGPRAPEHTAALHGLLAQGIVPAAERLA